MTPHNVGMDFYGVIGLFRDGAAPVLFSLGQNGLLLDILGKVHSHHSASEWAWNNISATSLAVGAPTVSPTANLAVGAPTVSPHCESPL